jgi:hypothetical protein
MGERPLTRHAKGTAHPPERDTCGTSAGAGHLRDVNPGGSSISPSRLTANRSATLLGTSSPESSSRQAGTMISSFRGRMTALCQAFARARRRHPRLGRFAVARLRRAVFAPPSSWTG